MISTLPVLSPFPNNVPSILSAPARIPSSASETPDPLSLCGCRERTTLSLYFKCLLTYSICVANTCGIAVSTVAGILIIAFCFPLGCHTSRTALQTSTAYSTSVPWKLSGLYSKEKSPSVSDASFFNNSAPSTASFLICSLSFLNTCSL